MNIDYAASGYKTFVAVNKIKAIQIIVINAVFNSIWSSGNLLNVNFFFWLILNYARNTRV